ncbi:hypothetical protein DS742_06170 [Lacrimispora amygdalina]|uniref:Succinate dehydrogenase n=1 Tax=Lacrimispora amygdalina TaxID=253257 RepID=A0A3E2NFY4_9FIRM|nr:hypothetical protein [Clostridium indicum]RFZ79821.1 hypothetical protein DS742_06170 [Clostridium indicum]
MILIKLFFKLLALPVVIIVTLIQWVGIFVTGFSAVLFNLAAGAFFMIALACLVTGVATGKEALQIFILSFAIFIIPHIAEWFIVRIAELNYLLRDFIKS